MVYVLQQFEPFGTGCQNSIDFMCKQIIRDANAPKLSLQLIEHDLGAIAKKEIHALAKKYQVPHQEILRTIDYIKTLRPFPIENSNVNQMWWM